MDGCETHLEEDENAAKEEGDGAQSFLEEDPGADPAHCAEGQLVDAEDTLKWRVAAPDLGPGCRAGRRGRGALEGPAGREGVIGERETQAEGGVQACVGSVGGRGAGAGEGEGLRWAGTEGGGRKWGYGGEKVEEALRGGDGERTRSPEEMREEACSE